MSSNTTSPSTSLKTSPPDLIKQILNFYSLTEDQALIERAYAVAEKAHGEQKRASGELYIIHPLDAALTLAQMHMDIETVVAALLHDVVDDTPVTLAEIKKQFGTEIAFLVDGVSKLGKLKYRGAERHAENLRKMLVAMAQDVRVILIKFADRLHNIKTLDVLPEKKRYRIALETLEIYAPTAARLGIAELAKQLEDLAFPYVYPEQFAYVKKEGAYRIKDAEKYLKRLRPILLRDLAKEGIKPTNIEMRAKHYYSLWGKLEKYQYQWDQIHDLVAVRIIVDSIENCYKTLGAIHKLWRPMPGRIKDYIALPKPNGYQSLHTTVFCIDGRLTEFQIRTPQMHEQAEYGIAAHWRYKDKKKRSKKELEKTYQWVEQLRDWKQDPSESDDLIENLKLDVFSDRIFVFTPQGDVIDLPQGATPIDFAYSIHSGIGDRCSAALCNGKMVAITQELQNGDVVEIVTSKNKTPSKTWLQFVKTRQAKNHIRRWFRLHNRDEHEAAGLEMINIELKALEGLTWAQLARDRKEAVSKHFSLKTDADLFAAIGEGKISLKRLINKLFEVREKKSESTRSGIAALKNDVVIIAGESGLKTQIAQCCKPVKPDQIVAYITVDRGATIHRIECPNASRGLRHNRILPAFWAGIQATEHITLRIGILDRVGMLQNISKCIAQLHMNIAAVHTVTSSEQKSLSSDSEQMLEFTIESDDWHQLRTLIEKLKTIEGVVSVERFH